MQWRWLKKVINLRRYKRQDFEARMLMEKHAQREVNARLTRLEIAYKNKTRMG